MVDILLMCAIGAFTFVLGYVACSIVKRPNDSTDEEIKKLLRKL